jgi:signal transduction histidine kinase
MFVFDSNLGNIDILYIGNENTKSIVESVLVELVSSISHVSNYSEGVKFLSENKVDIIINALEHHEPEQLQKVFQKISYISTTIPILLIIDEKDILQIRFAIKYNIDNFILYPIDKDIVVEELNRMVNNIYHEIEIKNINKQLQELNQTLEKRVEEEIKKNREKDHMMHHQSRLAAMGEMIGNIAHQWRQPLTAISTIIQSLEYKDSRGKLTSEFLKDQTAMSKQIVSQMSQTIDDFRNFFKPDKQKEIFNISKQIKSNINFVSIQFKNKDIETYDELDYSIEISSYKNELSQAVINILNNAKDALLSNNEKSRKLIFVKVELDSNKENVLIRIKDNAGGIPDEIINRVFEPYFTTKHKSHGTGIGLYMTKQIIETNMKGHIRVDNIMYSYENENYRGAEFVLSIPLDESN